MLNILSKISKKINIQFKQWSLEKKLFCTQPYYGDYDGKFLYNSFNFMQDCINCPYNDGQWRQFRAAYQGAIALKHVKAWVFVNNLADTY
jgi:hypothetical protein